MAGDARHDQRRAVTVPAPARPPQHEHPHVVERGAVLDIGADVGALVVTTSLGRDGEEIEVCPLGDPVRRTHTEVHVRDVGGVAVAAALFPALAAGRYRVLRRPGAAPGSSDPVLEVRGGEVTSLDLRVAP